MIMRTGRIPIDWKMRIIFDDGQETHYNLPRGRVLIIDKQDENLIVNVGVGISGYAELCSRKGGKRTTVLLHRLIMNAPRNMEVDHINNNPLDNRRQNLRLCTHTQNVRNVCKDAGTIFPWKGIRHSNQKYQALISVEGKRLHLGVFDTPLAAAIAYDKAARKYHGEFARTNFPTVGTINANVA